MNPYYEASAWADARGDSGGAQRMRRALLSLYNPAWYQYSVGEALSGLDEQGQQLLLACLQHYAANGETQQLVDAGARIEQSGYLAGWTELLESSHEAQRIVRSRWEAEAEERRRLEP